MKLSLPVAGPLGMDFRSGVTEEELLDVTFGAFAVAMSFVTTAGYVIVCVMLPILGCFGLSLSLAVAKREPCACRKRHPRWSGTTAVPV
jgi:hypothetical protein